MSGSRLVSSRVMRVRRVPSANASTFCRPATAAWTKSQQRPGVGLHRSADVEQQHEASQPGCRRQVVAFDRFAAGADGRADRPADVGHRGAPRRRAAAQRGAWRADQAQVAHQLLGLGEFVGGVVGEVLVPQDLGGREPQLDHLVVGGVGVVGAVGGVVVGVDRDGDRQRFFDWGVEPVRAAPFEEHGERPVVERDVLHPAHQRGAARPVGGVAIVESGRRTAQRRTCGCSSSAR